MALDHRSLAMGQLEGMAHVVLVHVDGVMQGIALLQYVTRWSGQLESR